jgi:hypothetical protein
MKPNQKHALHLYQETQRLALRTSPLIRPNCDYEVVEGVFQRGVEVNVSPQIVFIREPVQPGSQMSGGPDIMTQVFAGAFLGSSAFFALYALVTLIAGGTA